MSVWLTVPSKKPAPEAQACIDRWRARGYKAAIWRDAGDEPVECDLLLTGEYPGYARAVNALSQEAVKRGAEWCILAGDDIDPDPTHAPEDIARGCREHFADLHCERFNSETLLPWQLEFSLGDFVDWASFGVMQPTGDRWGADRNDRNFCGSAYADRVCGSAWCGAEFVRRMYGGEGPLWGGYPHMWVDEELQEVATRLGVLWQRRDLTQYHNHWGRTTGKMPEYLRQANADFNKTGLIFSQRKASGFPGHLPCA